MKYASLFVLSLFVLPVVDKHDAGVVQKSLNQSVEVLQPDAQKIENLKILAGGKTRAGDYLYVCEADLVWLLDRKEYLKRYESIARGVPFGELGAGFAKAYLPHFKKGDVISRVRLRVRFEEAGGDLIATSSKTIRFDLGFSSAVAKSEDD